jgi:putative ABC transport system substrate-binding protein
MRSRPFLSLLAAALFIAPLGADAQPATIPRIGWISLAGPEDADSSPFFEAFRAELRDLGYVEGRNLIIEARWARGDPVRGGDFARDLVQLGVAAIVMPTRSTRWCVSCAPSIAAAA